MVNSDRPEIRGPSFALWTTEGKQRSESGRRRAAPLLDNSPAFAGLTSSHPSAQHHRGPFVIGQDLRFIEPGGPEHGGNT